MNVLLADDHTLVRAGFRALLQGEEDMCIVAEVGDGLAALQALQTHRPDVAVLDMSMPQLSGLDVALKCRELGVPTRLLAVSMHVEPGYVVNARRAGFSGYLGKVAAAEELLQALRAVSKGGFYLGRDIDPAAVAAAEKTGTDTDLLRSLTSRQLDVLRLAAKGCSSKEIGHLLGISSKTVEIYRGQLLERLRAEDLTGLVRFAIRTGLISAAE